MFAMKWENPSAVFTRSWAVRRLLQLVINNVKLFHQNNQNSKNCLDGHQLEDQKSRNMATRIIP